ncbi:SCP2 sterol-binding domain-containing protein [Egibacter rhizosphaerae]|nr:SCP2 sterol-binding domain-containing protein [Egibacter rhizosphaerae]
MRAFCEELEAHPRAGEISEALDGTYRFVVEPAGPLEERHAYDVAIAPREGGGASVSVIDDGSEPALQLAANHDRWRQLLQGKLDVGMAVMLRRLRIKGDVGRLRSRLDSTGPLMDALRSVETEWLDDPT